MYPNGSIINEILCRHFPPPMNDFKRKSLNEKKFYIYILDDIINIDDIRIRNIDLITVFSTIYIITLVYTQREIMFLWKF